MAPPVRILSLLILAGALASGHPGVLASGMLILVSTGVLVRRRQPTLDARALVAMLRRIRWLLLAILILYGWFTPGTPLLPILGGWSPVQEGLQQGLLRVVALLGIVAAVYLLLASTPRGDLVGGLLWYGVPLRRLGVDDHRFAVRLVLALEAVPQVQTLARAALNEDAGRPWLQRVGSATARTLQATLARAEAGADTPLDVPDPQPVPVAHWLIPLALALMLVASALL
jgi:energy-coupling factor transporter transmembrane protein EcfT